MPSTVSVESPAIKPPATRLRLTMPSPTHLANLDALITPHSFDHPLSRPPSYSPVTPTFPPASSDADVLTRNQPDLIDEPDPVPVRLEHSSDAIALRAALSILQLQKQQSQMDIKQLDKMKAAANHEPERFIDALKAGQLSKPPVDAVVDIDDDSQDGEEKPAHRVSGLEGPEHDFGQFPNPQNVVRCPPINWAKYHIVGHSLDKLHEEQRHRPEPGQPRRDGYGRPPEHVVAAPYRPFIDMLEGAPNSTRRELKD